MVGHLTDLLIDSLCAGAALPRKIRHLPIYRVPPGTCQVILSLLFLFSSNSIQHYTIPLIIIMEEIPPELCLRVMELIPCLTTLRNFIISQQRVFRIFSTYQVTVLKSVIRNQFGENAKEVVFLATYTNRVSGATSVETRVNTIMRLHRFTWVDQQLNSNILRNLTEIGLVVDKLTVIFTSMAAELWKKAVHSTPPSSFPHAESRMRRAIYHYWILCRVYSEFVPARRHFFWASSLNPDRRTFEEFYRPFTIRQLLGMAFFEYCFFPRFMVDVCMDCTEGTCDGTYVRDLSLKSC